MLEGGETDLLRRSVELKKRLKQSLSTEERAKARQELQRIQKALRDRAFGSLSVEQCHRGDFDGISCHDVAQAARDQA